MAEISQEVALGWTVPDRLDRALIEDSVGQNPAAGYLASLSSGPSRRTMLGALNFIAGEFSEGQCGAARFPWHRLTYLHTMAMRAKLAERYAPATANKMLAALRGVLRECARMGLLQHEACLRACDLRPIRGARMPKGRELSSQEVEVLLMHAPTCKDKACLKFMLTTGLRRDEAAKVTWDDIEDRVVRVRGKGNKERLVPVPSVNDRLPFTGTADPRLFGMSAHRIWRMLRDTAFRAGLGVVTPHDLRRTYATRLLRAGVDLATVQKLMGHASPTTTVKYDRRDLAEAKSAVEGVFSWDGLL